MQNWLVIQWILWMLLSSVLNTYFIAHLICGRVNWLTIIEFSSQYILLLLNWFVLQWIVWLWISSVYNTFCHCSTDWCFSELCDWYSFDFSIHTVIAKLIGVTVNCVTFLSSVLNTYCCFLTVLCYSDLCGCYWVQFPLNSVIAQLIGVTVNCVIVIEFSPKQIFYWSIFFVKGNFVSVIQFNSPHIPLLLNPFGVTLNSVTVFQVFSQYILLLLYYMYSYVVRT